MNFESVVSFLEVPGNLDMVLMLLNVVTWILFFVIAGLFIFPLIIQTSLFVTGNKIEGHVIRKNKRKLRIRCEYGEITKKVSKDFFESVVVGQEISLYVHKKSLRFVLVDTQKILKKFPQLAQLRVDREPQ